MRELAVNELLVALDIDFPVTTATFIFPTDPKHTCLPMRVPMALPKEINESRNTLGSSQPYAVSERKRLSKISAAGKWKIRGDWFRVSYNRNLAERLDGWASLSMQQEISLAGGFKLSVGSTLPPVFG